MNNDDEKIEEALLRRRFDEWTFRGITLLFPIVMALAGWAQTLQTKLQEIATKQEERGPRIAELEVTVKRLAEEVRDPGSKPETKVALENIVIQQTHFDQRVDRIEERLNSLHNYLLNVPHPLPKGNQRGDALLRPPSIQAQEIP